MSKPEVVEPLTPPDCDLRDFAFMPLDVQRLRSSDLASVENPETCWAALMLWCAAWHQVPAASLPDDDRVLASFAGYGRSIKRWMKVKEGAMRGFIKATDGRLYHPLVAEKAKQSWEKKKIRRRSGQAGAASRWSGRNLETTTSANSDATVSKDAVANGTTNGGATAVANGGAIHLPMAKNGKSIVDSREGDKKAKAKRAENPEKSVSKSAALQSFALTPELRTWAKDHGWDAFIEAHFNYFVDYLKTRPNNRYKDLEAAFRNCVRGDWGNIRRNGVKESHQKPWYETTSGVQQAAAKLNMKWEGASVEPFIKFALRVKEAFEKQHDKPP